MLRKLTHWMLGMYMSQYYYVVAKSFISENSFRQTPTFGRDTIRKFSTNSSEMKKLAARDYEDLLQVRLLFIPNIKAMAQLPAVRYPYIRRFTS